MMILQWKMTYSDPFYMLSLCVYMLSIMSFTLIMWLLNGNDI